MSAYVCSTHTTQPVTWRGTGCRICAKPAEQRQRDEETAMESWRLAAEFHRTNNKTDQEVAR